MSERVWVWVGHMGLGERIQHVLENFGDRITDVSIFGWSVWRDGTLEETFDPSQLDSYREMWPHIRWWLCFRNMDGTDAEEVGPRAIFDALRTQTSSQDRLLDEISDIFSEHPWLHGVDIDLESGGDEMSEESEALFSRIAQRAHSHGKLCGAALPPLTATGSVGGENWVRYYQLGQILDNLEIMSYDFAWSGSAPGPISPGFWMEDVYNWVTSQVTPSKVYMGIPFYAYYWRIHDYPPNLGNPWRGLSGTYYSFWQQFTGATPWYDPGVQPLAGWLTYRDRESRSLWGLLHAYDWLQPSMYSSSHRVNHDVYQGKQYSVRFGQPSGNPLWTIADNGPGQSYMDFEMKPEPVVDVNGEVTGPYNGFTLTLERLTREPVAATIIDDYVTSDTIWRSTDGFEEVEPWDGYRQWRGQGTLEWAENLQSTYEAIYTQARGQFAEDGTFSVYAYGWEAEYRNTDGRLRLLRDGSVEETTYVSARSATTADRASQFVLGLRVRPDSARVYFSNTEEGRIPNVLEHFDAAPPGGPVGNRAETRVFLDHLYLGDGWYYQPREAFEVTVNGESHVMGRLIRDDVTWEGYDADDRGMFRPNEDVDEWETRADQWTEYSIMDWGFEHWQDAPFDLDQQSTVRIVPLDHDVWLGMVIVFDREGGFISYCNDAQAVAHWRARAENEWQLAGIAAWSVGQEDVRVWDVLAGGEFSPDDKFLDE